ncbi:MAG: Asparagine synthetase (glutamine-hydrolyzing) 1 [Syntrophorhabdus sp. PtaU1.Bin153]|nr:MAG: Asparagine synthetase (glutamine-hydrolyzing) 1 [Syntrophorhabdus sp. PtaU1.Bin153]
MAACRLSIFGNIEAPMTYLDPATGCVALLNGEIYNYTDLWNQLIQVGDNRHTDLEAELITHLYDRYGLGFASYLKGMFAIALFDRDRLILARDRFGIKPLYYAVLGRKVIVSSEVKGILAHPDVTPRLNMDAFKESAVFGYVADREATFFQGIYQVLPGSVVVFGQDGLIEKRLYSSLPAAYYRNDTPSIPYDDACLKVRESVIEAVERTFSHGKMDKGIYLSGGVDSSTIALIARNILGLPVQTFTMTDSEDNPDFDAASRVAKALHTSHNGYLVKTEDYWRAFVDYIAHYESVMAGGVFHIQGGVAFHLLSERVSQKVKVAYSGEGADELFGGYYWIYTHPLGFSDRIRNNMRTVMPDNRIETIVNDLFPFPEDEMVYRRNLLSYLLKGGLSNYHLQSVDRSGGAFGFEIRPVYLYDDLASCAMGQPIEFKVPDKRTTKRILRDAFRKDFEEAGITFVQDRLKLGMPSAISQIDEEITETVNKVIYDEELANHPYGTVLGSKMNLLCYDLFEQIFFKGWNHEDPEPPQDSLLARVWPR